MVYRHWSESERGWLKAASLPCGYYMTRAFLIIIHDVATTDMFSLDIAEFGTGAAS